MEEELSKQPKAKEEAFLAAIKEKGEKPEVYIARNWKEYLGESILIIFSVVFALVVKETFNKIHEKQQTHEILNEVKTELIKNLHAEEEQYKYHLGILKNIDSALSNPALARQFINNGVLNIKTIIPDGVLYRDLNDVAWEVAKQNNIFSKINLTEYSLLTDIYANQARINKSEQEIANVLLSRESRTARDNRVTLLLLHDNYHGWAVDRAPALLIKYQQAIDELDNYK